MLREEFSEKIMQKKTRNRDKYAITEYTSYKNRFLQKQNHKQQHETIM